MGTPPKTEKCQSVTLSGAPLPPGDPLNLKVSINKKRIKTHREGYGGVPTWTYRDIEETFMQVPELTDAEHRRQISAVIEKIFADGEQALERLRNSQAHLSRVDRHEPETAPPPSSRRTHDNLGTELAPVWRGRLTTPLTPYTIRLQLLAQAEGATQAQRQAYVRRRLTALDRALTDDEAAALEEWLICEEMRDGRAKGQSWGDSGGGGNVRPSPLPDRMMARMRRHADRRRRIPAVHLATLNGFAAMMRNAYWDFGPRAEQRRTIAAIKLAAAWLAAN